MSPVGAVEESAIGGDLYLRRRIVIPGKIVGQGRYDLKRREGSRFCIEVMRRNGAAVFVDRIEQVLSRVKGEVARAFLGSWLYLGRVVGGQCSVLLVKAELKYGVGRVGMGHEGEAIGAVGLDAVGMAVGVKNLQGVG